MSTPTPPHLTHEAPLTWLVREKLHKGRTLTDNVKRLRWRRKRPAATEAEV